MPRFKSFLARRFVAAFGLLATFAAAAAEPVSVQSTVELFNGKDLSGWVVHSATNTGSASTWLVTNGVIHCSGQPWGYLRTERAYRDYQLTVEWRFVSAAAGADNTGILLHVQSPDRVWPAAIECQGKLNRHGDIILMGGTTCRVDGEEKRGRVAMTGSANEKPAGEWNTYQIVCAGSSMKVSVNGKILNDVSDCSVSSGFIAIQSEGGRIEVRRVTLKAIGEP